MTCFSSRCFQDFFCLWLSTVTILSRDESFVFTLLEFCEASLSVDCFSPNLGSFWQLYFQVFFFPLSLLSFCNSHYTNLMHLILFHIFLRLCSFFFSLLYSLFFRMIFINLGSCRMFLVISNVLLNPKNEFEMSLYFSTLEFPLSFFIIKIPYFCYHIFL